VLIGARVGYRVVGLAGIPAPSNGYRILAAFERFEFLEFSYALGSSYASNIGKGSAQLPGLVLHGQLATFQNNRGPRRRDTFVD
jgi:hypothetical protein